MFEQLGLSKQQEQLYRLLIDEPELSATALAHRLTVSPDELNADISRLKTLGLLRDNTLKDGLSVTDPEAAVSVLVQDRKRHLDKALQESLALAEKLRRSQQSIDVNSIIEVVTGEDAIRARWEHAQKTAREQIRMTDRPPYYAGAKIEGMNIQLARMAEGLPFHTLYDARIFDHPHHLHRARHAIDAGEIARVLPEVPIKFVLVDDQMAFLVLLSSAEQHEPTVILVHKSALLDSLDELYKLLWSRGVAMPSGQVVSGDDAGNDAQRNLVALLAAGLKDEAIAIELGVTARTVRRKVQDLYEQLGVRNRFQAGIAVKERGWL